MYKCNSCFQMFPRRTVFVHMSQCKRQNFDDASNSSELMSDDSYKDPLWSPSAVDEISESSAASPVTDAQAEVAVKAAEMLIDVAVDEISESSAASPVTDAQAEVAVKAAEMFIDISESSRPSLAIKKEMFQERLKALRVQIEEWTQKRKEALGQGKKSKARRLAKNIKGKLEFLKSQNEVLSSRSESNNQVNEENRQETIHEMPTKQSGGRKKNYCMYCNKLVLKFSVHVEKQHMDTPEGKILIDLNNNENDRQKRRLLKIKATSSIRNKWNGIFNKKVSNDGDVITAKRHGKGKKADVVCKHCDGVYKRDKMYVHLKYCQNFLSSTASTDDVLHTSTSQALKNHSNPILNETVLNTVTQVFVDEILQGISGDEVIEVAMKDKLIMEFGSNFHKSHREPSSRGFVRREMKDLARLLLQMKKINNNINTMCDCFNPVNFNTLIDAALQLAKYEEKTGEVGVPSIAYRLTQPLKDCANLLKANELKKGYENVHADRKVIMMVDDFLNLVNSQWRILIGRICTKSQKKRKADKNDKMALDDDISKLSTFIEGQYRKTMKELENKPECKTYDLLTHMLVSHIMLLIRRRPVDFKHAKLRHFNNIDKHDEVISMANGHDLTPEEIERCKKFHLFYAPGKNLELIPIVLTPLMKCVLETLIRFRNMVNITCDTLFIKSGGKMIYPNESLKFMVRRVPSLKKPDHLTGNGLRHQAATFSKFHSSHPLYQDYLASALGHTLAVHKKHYDLPQGVLHKLLVCPILHDIMTGKNKKRKNEEEGNTNSKKVRSLADTNMNESQEDRSIGELVGTPKKIVPVAEESSESSSDEDILIHKSKKRWSELEQEVVLSHFGPTILNKIVPKRGEIVEFLKSQKEVLSSRSVSQVLLFVRNHATRNQLNVSPKVSRILKKCN